MKILFINLIKSTLSCESLALLLVPPTCLCSCLPLFVLFRSLSLFFMQVKQEEVNIHKNQWTLKKKKKRQWQDTINIIRNSNTSFLNSQKRTSISHIFSGILGGHIFISSHCCTPIFSFLQLSIIIVPCFPICWRVVPLILSVSFSSIAMSL